MFRGRRGDRDQRGVPSTEEVDAGSPEALRERWRSDERRTASVLKALRGNGSLSKVLGRTPDGLLDARGLVGPLAKIGHRGEVAGPAGSVHFDVLADRLTLAGCALDGIDFSFAALPHLLISDGTLVNCRFDDAQLTGATFVRTTCRDVSFRRAVLGGGLGGFRGRANVYERVNFQGANLGQGLPSAILRGCSLGPLERTYFGSSEFYDCTFAGTFRQATFHGIVPLPGGKPTPGCLRDCDFSAAELHHVSFVGTDLSSCAFSEEILRIDDFDSFVEAIAVDERAQSGASAALVEAWRWAAARRPESGEPQQGVLAPQDFTHPEIRWICDAAQSHCGR